MVRMPTFTPHQRSSAAPPTLARPSPSLRGSRTVAARGPPLSEHDESSRNEGDGHERPTEHHHSEPSIRRDVSHNGNGDGGHADEDRRYCTEDRKTHDRCSRASRRPASTMPMITLNPAAATGV